MAERIPFRGGLACTCIVESLPWVERELNFRGLLSGRIPIYQLGYRTDVDASAGTHSRGGCVDVGTYSRAQIDIWRLHGWTMQDRSPFFNFDHAHGWPYKCPHLSEAAQQQEDDWDRKDAGLVGNAQVQGRWPVKPWHIALKERKALLEQIQLGVPLMANAVPIQISYSDDQPLETGGNVHKNKDGHTSIVTGSSEAIDCTAAITVEGLQPDEHVKLRWAIEWKKDGQLDKNKGSKVPVTLVPTPGETTGTAQVRWADNLAKADTGWTACLRLRYSTNSSTAKITRRTFEGWKLA